MEKKKMGLGKKILIGFLIILLILILLVVVHTLRNYLIVKDLQDKISVHDKSLNYHVEVLGTHEKGAESRVNYYRKENKEAYILERIESGELVGKLSYYNNGERIDFFAENISGEKIAKLGESYMPKVEIMSGLGMTEHSPKILECFMYKIKQIDYEGKECYEIKIFYSPDFLYEDEGGESSIIVEKETGINVKVCMGESISEKRYEFDNVDDSIFIEPNIGEYKLQINDEI